MEGNSRWVRYPKPSSEELKPAEKRSNKMQRNGQGQARALDHDEKKDRGRIIQDQIPWKNIQEPGSYLEVRSGELYQFPEKAFDAKGTSPTLLVRRISNVTPVLIMLTTDADISVTDARNLAEERGFSVNF